MTNDTSRESVDEATDPFPGTARVRVLRAVLLLGFAAVPLVHHSDVQEHIYVRVPYLLALATLVWVAAAARCLTTRWVPPRPPLAILAAVWLGLAALSIHWAKSPALVPVAVSRDLVLMAAAGAFAMLASPVRPLALSLLAGGGALALGSALTEHFVTGDRYLWRPFYQSSLAGGFAAVMLAGSVSALFAAAPRGARARWTTALLVGLAVLAALLLYRTAALTATGAGVAGCVAGVLATRGRTGRILAVLVPLGALLAGGGLLLYYGTVLQHPSAEIRLLLWEGALQMCSSDPLGGVGYGGFGANFPEFRPDGYWQALYATNWTPHAHSLYLELGACLGIPGLVLTMVFVPLALHFGARRVSEATRDPDRRASAAVLGAFAAIAIAAIADLPADYPLGRFLFFALAGLCTARSAREEVEAGGAPDLFVRRSFFVSVALALIIQCALVETGLVASRMAYREAEGQRVRSEAMLTEWAELQSRSGIPAGREELRVKLIAALRETMASYDDASELPTFETEWTLRARLFAASLALQLAALEPGGTHRFELLHAAKERCAVVESIAPDFEDNELIYALIEYELGDQVAFQLHLRNYLERRLVWDLRANLLTQVGPAQPAWRFVLDRVPPRAELFRWTLERVEAIAARDAERDHGAKLIADEVAELFRERLR